jgi:hypothetical protein
MGCQLALPGVPRYGWGQVSRGACLWAGTGLHSWLPLQVALLETNPYLLALTIIVSIVHSVFEFLAFKNGRCVTPGRDWREGSCGQESAWQGRGPAPPPHTCLPPAWGFLALLARGLVTWESSAAPKLPTQDFHSPGVELRGAGPAVWAEFRAPPPGSRAGELQGQEQGSPRAAPAPCLAGCLPGRPLGAKWET